MICSSIYGWIEDYIIKVKLLVPDDRVCTPKALLLGYSSGSVRLGEKCMFIIRDGLQNALGFCLFKELISLCGRPTKTYSQLEYPII